MSGRPLLMIPGPVEMSDDVLLAAGSIGTSHVDPSFIASFSRVLKGMREVFLAPDGQPFVMAGSGSLGWDAFGANVLEPGQEVLVIAQGYFGDSFAEFLRNQGVAVTVVAAPRPGDYADLAQIQALDLKRFRAVTITHVDTSTAVVAPLKELAALLRKANPDIIIAVDAVASLGGEPIRMTEWDVDYVMTGSQKGLAVPAGLCLSVVRPRALKAALESRKEPVRFTYVAWHKWLPVMQAYEALKPSYFATPAVSLVLALEKGLAAHLADGGVEQRFREHAATGAAFRAGLAALNLSPVAVRGELCAATLTAIYYPEGIDGDALRTAIKRHGAIVAGGLHKEIGTKYFRVGHMGVSSRRREDLLVVLKAIEAALLEQGAKIQPGAAAAAFEASIKKSNL